MVRATEVTQRIGGELVRVFEEIGINPQLVDTFDERVVRPIEVQFDGLFEGQRSGYFLDLPSRKLDENQSSIMALGRGSIENWGVTLQEAFEAAGIEPKYEGQIQDLTFAWMIAHELGHGLQQVYSLVNRTTSPYGGGTRWRYPQLTYDYLQVHPEDILAPDIDDARLIDNERIAEGIGATYTRKLLIEVGYPPEDADAILAAIRARFQISAAKINSLLQQADEPTDYRTITQEMDDAPDITVVGYAQALTPELIRDRFLTVPAIDTSAP